MGDAGSNVKPVMGLVIPKQLKHVFIPLPFVSLVCYSGAIFDDW